MENGVYSCNSITQQGVEILIYFRGGSASDMEEEVFLTTVIFTLEEAQCRRNASLYHYAIQLCHQQRNIKISSHEHTSQKKDLNDYNADRVGRLHELLLHDIELRKCAYVQLRIRLITECQTKECMTK
jgi:hypothetical protein